MSSTNDNCQHWLIGSTRGGGGRKHMLLHLNESQMLAHSHFQAEDLDVVFIPFYLCHRWWLHYPDCLIFHLWLFMFSTCIPPFAEALSVFFSPKSDLISNYNHTVMEIVRHVRKWKGHRFRNNCLCLLLLVSPLFKTFFHSRGWLYPVLSAASGISRYKCGTLGITALLL